VPIASAHLPQNEQCIAGLLGEEESCSILSLKDIGSYERNVLWWLYHARFMLSG
jgi:hypothetical protein